MSDIDDLALSGMKELVAAQEHYIINFFGTAERARELAHLYILEDHGTELELVGEYKLQMTSSWRLRLKTPKELALSQE